MTAQERHDTPEPTKVDEVQATDRLLSRLGARSPEPGDLDDPLFGALHALAREVDHEETSTEDEAMRRLVDALGGRPLYVLDGEDLLDPQAGADLVLIDDPTWEDEPRPSRVIDLTTAEQEPAPEAEPAEPEVVEQPAAEERPAPAARVAELRPADRPGLAAKVAAGRPEGGWQAAARKLSLPVAAGIAVFALGGGITSALTGNPISPVTGVIDALPGQDDGGADRITLASVQDTLVRAQQAVEREDYDTARALFAEARELLESVPPAQARVAQQAFKQATETAPQAALPDDVSLPALTPDQQPGTVAPTSVPAATPRPVPTEPVPTTPPVTVTPTPPATPTPTDSPSPTNTPADTEPSTAPSAAEVLATP